MPYIIDQDSRRPSFCPITPLVATNTPDLPKVSVIVPVRNRAILLRECLSRLSQQSYPSSHREIIVVDNGSTDDLDAVRGMFPSIRWYKESGESSYAARNRGLREATGDIIAFTDADCQPSLEWIEKAVEALRSTGATIVGGEIKYIDPTDRHLNVSELLEEKVFGMGNHRRLIEERGFAVTANLIAYKLVFDRIGHFDSELKSSGDRLWTQRAVARGESLRFADHTRVDHPRRGSLRELFKKQRRIVGGRTRLLSKVPTPFLETLFQLYSQSVLDVRMYYRALTDSRIDRLTKRVHYVAAVFAFCAVTTYERLRVLLGGNPCRD